MHHSTLIEGKKFFFFFSNYNSGVPEAHKKFLEAKEKTGPTTKRTDYHNFLFYFFINDSDIFQAKPGELYPSNGGMNGVLDLAEIFKLDLVMSKIFTNN